MATVYLAQDLKHDRPVALKVLHHELAATLGPGRFLREIRLAARLQHPHILTVLDSGEAASQLWFTMPYVEGESLRHRLIRERQLPVEDAVRIATEAGLALDFAHRHGVIHRDIKPENILLCDGQALVADFGVGRALGLSAPGERLTETGTVVGTPAYMSPEQASGDRALDGRTDIYSLGLVLYEMLAGEVPFAGPTEQATLSRRFTEAPRPLRQVRETVPQTVEQAALKALAKAPADRFQTAAEFAHALAVPIPPTPAPSWTPPAPGRPLAGRAVALAGAAMALLGALVVFAVRGRQEGPNPLDPNLVAVAPFDVLQPSLSLWREGLVDLLARNLDGAGPLRTVSPTLVVRRWEGRADRASAAALATTAGAGLAIYGTLVGTGPDSVRLTASVLDVGRGEVVGEAELRGTADRMDQLADSLTVQVLRELAPVRPIGATRSSGLGSRALPALRAFLRGEQWFRRAEWDSAQISYERAVALDTTFALAYWRLGTIRGWKFSIQDSLGHVFSRRAAALNQGLPPRESLLIVCDSLMSAVEGGLPDPETRATLQRLFGTTDLVTTRYPTDPEAWAALGEARYHYGPGLGVSDRIRLEPFQQAVALDSSYAPAYIHLVEMALTFPDRAAARRYVARYLSLRPGGQQALIARAIAVMLDTTVRAGAIEHLLDTMPDAALAGVWGGSMLAPDSAELAIRVARHWVKRRSGAGLFSDPAFRHGALAATLAYRGHLHEAAQHVMAHPRLAQWGLFVELALAGTIPADTADAFYRRRLNREPLWSDGDPLGEQEGLVWGPPWWAARGDSTSLKGFLKRIGSRRRSTTPPAGAVTNPYLRQLSQAYLALTRGDTVAAVTGFAALPDSTGGEVWLERLTLARLLDAQGRSREALAVLDLEFPHLYVTASHGIWALERARLAEKLGQREKARNWYGHVVALWRYADPELQRSVAEAREALERLTDESSR